MLKLDNISKKTGNFSLSDICFTVEKGNYFVLIGASGAGKTMILEIISGLTKSDSGSIFLNNTNITNSQIQQRKTGIVYQSQSLFPHLNVFENIAFALKCNKLSAQEIKQQVYALAEETEISHLLNRHTSKLSGGEAQRIAIARTLAAKPEILLLDEPLSFLDIQLKKGISSLLRKINKKGQTIIHVTHDYEEAVSLANKIGIIENGALVQTGTPYEIFHKPKSKFVADFVGIKNFYEGKIINFEKEQNLKVFQSGNIKFYLLSEEYIESCGHIIIPGESITISVEPYETSAINKLHGTIKDIIPAKFGVEVVVDIGTEISSQISSVSAEKLNLSVGKSVFLNFKASAVKFIKS